MGTIAANPDIVSSARVPSDAQGLGTRLVQAALFLTILCSPFVFIEPSVYEVGVLGLGLACVMARLPLPRRILPLFVLMLIWGISGAAALVPVAHDNKAVVYFLVSFYLQMSAVLFACVVASDTMRRMDTLRTAYILAAVIAAAIGIAGYFKFVPFSDILLENGRVRSTFKDPNVFAPFLILPILFLIQRMLFDGARVRTITAFALLLAALLLSFSRGAWAHFACSAAIMLVLMFLTAPSARFRTRIVTIAVMAVAAMAAGLAVLLMLESVSSMFTVRASLVQEYDIGQGGRFGRQIASLDELLDNPNGFGPEQFGKLFGQAPHNVYLNAFASYGWVGGIAFLTLTVTTLIHGFRALLVRTPWQPYLLAVYATFAGLMAEGLIIDTDHWRHLFLLFGLVWGLVAATERARSQQGAPVRRDAGDAAAATSAGSAALVSQPVPSRSSGDVVQQAPTRDAAALEETSTGTVARADTAKSAAAGRPTDPRWQAYLEQRRQAVALASPPLPQSRRPERTEVSPVVNASGSQTVRALLFATILVSPLVFIEPSAYEGLVMLLAIALLVAGSSVSRYVLPMAALLLGWAIGGALAVMPVLHDGKAVISFLISFYLQMTAVLFACLFATDTMRRLATLRVAYIWAAVIAAIVGIVGYFQLVPGSDMLLLNGRARATFKDPNVFGPFLVLPLLLLIQDVFARGPRLRSLLPGAVILIGLFLTFSRGAWGHFVASVAVMVALMFVTAPTQRFRARVVAASVAAAVGAVVILAALMSLGTVGDMFAQRASLVQSYDGGPTGRFATQATSILGLLDHPLGYGPEQFPKIFGQAPHNTYINAFATYGWIGGFMYVLLTLVTLTMGLRAALARTPWQPFAISVYACFVGLAAESLIIDTDHWRHYFLLLGLVWGLVAATKKAQSPAAEPAGPPSQMLPQPA